MLVALLVVLSAVPVVPRGSTIAVDPLGRGSWAIDEETDSVALVPSRGAPRRIDVGRWPEQLVLDSSGRLFVSCRQQGSVDVIAPDFTVQSIAVGVEPGPLFLDEARHRLFVGLITPRELIAIDTRSLAVVSRRRLDFEPAALELTPSGLAVLTRRGGEVGFVSPDLAPDASFDWWVQLPSGDGRRQSWQGVAMARIESDLVVIHTTVDTGLGALESSGLYGGGGSAPILTALTVLRKTKPIHTEANLPLQDVTGIAVDGRKFAIASRGNRFVVRGTWKSEAIGTFEVTAGEGLSGVAFDGRGSVVALAAFDRAVVRVGLRSRAGEKARTLIQSVFARAASPRDRLLQILGTRGLGTGEWSGSFVLTPNTTVSEDFSLAVLGRSTIGPGKLDAELAKGRSLFHAMANEGISSNGLGCVSCHPNGREDGLVWRLSGTRRQTPLLAGRLKDTGPYNWKGSAQSLMKNVQQTTRRMGGRGLSAANQKALARYLVAGLRPVGLPQRGDEALVQRGSALFHDQTVGCAGCHPSDNGFTDAEVHDVGSLGTAEEAEIGKVTGQTADDRLFDTPDLRGLAVTAPYFHDGSAVTLEQLLDENDDRMGHTRALSADQREALAAYLRSL